MEVLVIIEKIWPVVIAIMGVIWKQIAAHFEIQYLKTNQKNQDNELQKLDVRFEHLQKAFADSLKEHIAENNKNTRELKDAITELIKTTTALTTEFKYLTEKSR